MGYMKSVGTTFIYIGLFLALVALLPGIPPHVQFSEYSTLSTQLPSKDDPHFNNRLDDVEILFKGELKGPEYFASYNGELYTTLHGGDVVKIVGKHIVPIVKFGKPCDGFWMEKECGRPLGLQFDKNGKLYVIDTYIGIFKVDVTTGKYEKIVDISKPIEGVIPKLPNSLDVASNGDVYWTDSSSEFILQDGVLAALANPSGRLIKYDAATKKNTVLLTNLALANGVKLSKDESFVIVAESVMARLIKLNLKGDKKGKAETFIEGLAGLPDNIHTDGRDGFLLSLVLAADAEHPILLQSLAPHPHVRRMLVRLIYLLEVPFKLIEDVYPNYYSKRAIHWLGHFESINALNFESAAILRIDVNGKIIDSAYSVSGKISSISSGFIFKDDLYLGSPYNDYLGKIPLSRAFPSIKIVADKIVDEKVIKKREVKEAPKPTTTPASPTTSTTVKSETVTTTTKPETVATTTKPKTVPTTPKPAAAPTQKPVTAPPPTKPPVATPPPTKAPVTTPPPAKPPVATPPPTKAPVTTPPPTKPPVATPPPQQQQQATPKQSKPSNEQKPEPVRQVPTSTPPPQVPPKKVPAKEAKPTELPPKPVAQKQTVKNADRTDDKAKKTAQNVNNAQKETKAVPATGDTQKKVKDEKLKPPVANKN